MCASGSEEEAGSGREVAGLRGEGGGREAVEDCMLGGVEVGLEGGEAWRRRFVRREERNAVRGVVSEGWFGRGGNAMWMFLLLSSRST